MDLTGFVNGSHNVCRFSGYSWVTHDGFFYLRQTKDPAKALRFRVSRGFRAPPENRAFEVKAHILAVNRVPELHFISMQSASVNSIPAFRFWFNALRGTTKGHDPFDDRATMYAQIRQQLDADDEVMESIIKQASQGQKRGMGFKNRVLLSGFIGDKGYNKPTTPDGEPSITMVLMQHPDASRGIPVIISGVDSTFGSELRSHMPIAIKATASTRIDDRGEPTLVIHTNRLGIGSASLNIFEGGRLPAWGARALKQHHEELIAKRKVREQARATSDDDSDGGSDDGGAADAVVAASTTKRRSHGAVVPATTNGADDASGLMLTDDEIQLGLTPAQAIARRKALAAAPVRSSASPEPPAVATGS